MRTYSNKVNRLASIAYGIPPDKFQIYIHPDWISDEKALALREDLKKSKLFEEAGSYTLTSHVNEGNLSQLHEIFDALLVLVEEQTAS